VTLAISIFLFLCSFLTLLFLVGVELSHKSDDYGTVNVPASTRALLWLCVPLAAVLGVWSLW
jgi:hypothetical protein